MLTNGSAVSKFDPGSVFMFEVGECKVVVGGRAMSGSEIISICLVAVDGGWRWPVLVSMAIDVADKREESSGPAANFNR